MLNLLSMTVLRFLAWMAGTSSAGHQVESHGDVFFPKITTFVLSVFIQSMTSVMQAVAVNIIFLLLLVLLIDPFQKPRRPFLGSIPL